MPNYTLARCAKYLNKCLQPANKNSESEKMIPVPFVIGDEKGNEMPPYCFFQPQLGFALYPLPPTKRVQGRSRFLGPINCFRNTHCNSYLDLSWITGKNDGL